LVEERVMELTQFERIVVLTGAGISAESGISTFRDAGGLWEKHRIEDVATPEAFERDPRLVWKFYSARRENAFRAQPNAAHLSLARFAKEHPGRLTLVTQNVDGLHERAAQSVGDDPARVLAMHGTLSKSRCRACGKVIDDPGVYPDTLPSSPCCQQLLRPHIVWFGEMPLEMDRIEEAVSLCDAFVSIGTSGNVYPAAGLIELAKSCRATTFCLNPEPIPQRRVVDHHLQGKATELVPRLFGLPVV